MDNPGHVFSSVAIAEETNEKDAIKEGQSGDLNNESSEDIKTEDKPVDPLFADPQAEVIQMGADKPEKELTAVVSPEVETVSGPEEVVEVAPASVLETPPVAVQPMAPSWRPATVKDGWRPTLVGTLMDGPTPRAILAMPSGEERVVKAGDMLSDDGVVVMTIGDKFIELAVIRSAEGRAQIENLTLSTQF